LLSRLRLLFIGLLLVIVLLLLGLHQALPAFILERGSFGGLLRVILRFLHGKGRPLDLFGDLVAAFVGSLHDLLSDELSLLEGLLALLLQIPGPGLKLI